jgi:hypothetical protein
MDGNHQFYIQLRNTFSKLAPELVLMISDRFDHYFDFYSIGFIYLS